MLITCTECGLPVSDKAILCPHCGISMTTDIPSLKVPKKSSKRMKLPNGFGQITELKNQRLRKPFRASITVGKTTEGKPIQKLLKPISYFETYNEAYMALIEYNKNPYDLDTVMTVMELYEKWSTEYFTTIQPSSKRTITAAWAYCDSVKDMAAKDIRVRHIQGCMETCDSPNTKNRIKSMFNLMLDYALKYEIVDKNYARDFKIERVETENGHNSFTTEEVEKLWKYQSDPFICFVLLQTYMGWRPQELCKIKISDVDLENFTITGGMKTDAGRNRVVPVVTKIHGVLKKVMYYSSINRSDHLICMSGGEAYTYDKYYKRFIKEMGNIGIIDHKPHDCRKTFISICKNAGVDEYAIKYAVGHAITDLTEKVYTDRDPNWLSNELEKICE